MDETSTFIALLRGINVGGHNKLPMRELRELCGEIGWREVQTYVQSGNVVFQSDGTQEAAEAQLEQGLERRFGLSVAVLVRPAADWRRYVQGNPFPDESEREPKLVLLALSKSRPDKGAAGALEQRGDKRERVVRVGDALWIHYPGGSGRSKLSGAPLDRLAGSPVTTRNWRTVLKLDELARPLPRPSD